MKQNFQIHYKNEDDEVISFPYESFKVDENYEYLPSSKLIRFWSWLSYKFIATPFIFIYIKLIKRVKFVNKRVLKNFKKGGYFVYANHTNQFCDAFSPSLICFPKKPHIIVDSANISIPFWGKLTKIWGAIPTPNTIGASKNFSKTIEEILSKNNPIIIYPEAHLWPYYTKIRNFNSTSFRFPIKYNKPIFTFTTTYHKRKFGKSPKIIIYIDGPFTINSSLEEKESQKNLHTQIHNKLQERSKLSNYEFINYIRSDDD